jgi:hypothetical protein
MTWFRKEGGIQWLDKNPMREILENYNSRI